MPDQPEWVHVWGWLRFACSNYDPLPQQRVPNAISDEEYEKHRTAWVTAGAPTITQKQLLDVFAVDKIPF